MTTTDDIFAQQILDDGNNPRLREQIPNLALVGVSRANRVTIAAGLQNLSEQPSEVDPIGIGFQLVENADALQVTIAIELLDLNRRQRSRRRIDGGMKAQIARDLCEIVLGGKRLEGGCIHGLFCKCYAMIFVIGSAPSTPTSF